MVATRRRVRASALVIAGVIVLAGCSSEQTLAPDPAGAEPGYPQYTPPVTSPDGVSPDGAPDPVETSDEPEAPSISPSATPTAEPTVTPTVSPSPTPSPPAAPEPTAAPTTTTPAPTPTPTTPPASAAPTTPVPTTPAPTTPAAVTLQTQTWQPRCGTALTAPAVVNDLTVAVSLQAAAGGPLQTESVLTNGADEPVAPERYVASVTIARSGTIVSTWVEGQDAGPAIALGARGTLVVPVFHDLAETCPSGGVRSPAPPPVESTARTTSTTASVAAPQPPTEDDLVLNPEPAGGTGQLGTLPAGDYTAVVAIHLVRDGGIGTSVVATSGVVPLTVSDT